MNPTREQLRILSELKKKRDEHLDADEQIFRALWTPLLKIDGRPVYAPDIWIFKIGRVSRQEAITIRHEHKRQAEQLQTTIDACRASLEN